MHEFFFNIQQYKITLVYYKIFAEQNGFWRLFNPEEVLYCTYFIFLKKLEFWNWNEIGIWN